MELLNIMKNRRSVRTYTGEAVTEEQIEKILQAALLSASGKAIRPWEFVVVKNKETLAKLAESRAMGAGMLTGADCAIVVIADADKSDVWTEDCSIAMANMHLMADALGLGSCWIQGRLRMAADGRTTEEYTRELLKFPENYKLEAILSLGVPQDHPAAYELETLDLSKVHREVF